MRVDLPAQRQGEFVEAPDPETGGRAVHLVVQDLVLDNLRAGGWISQFQYDAGLALRELWQLSGVRGEVRAMNMNAAAGTTGEQRHVADPAMFAEYLKAMRLVHVAGRGVVRAVCIEDLPVAVYAWGLRADPGELMARLQKGLSRLARDFSR